ncbi:MAG: prenyltransferase/squalene oxidase repeat-containing protein [Planctomycetota bacterium]|jgi:squalene-hopene/tetraprenyl-beta-curcumene cyclase
MVLDKDTLTKSLQKLMKRLLDSRTSEGFWEGRLSSSALSTATAVFALGMVDRKKYRLHIQHGLNWLCENSNSDGGWGDTPLSLSNISTTMLCWSAFIVAENSVQYDKTIADAEKWLIKNAGSLKSEQLLKAVNVQYGKDRSFSSPILTMCALAGRLNGSEDIWKSLKPLPFELAVMPHKFYKFLRLQVVSYALPALIAIGQLHFHRHRPVNPIIRLLRYLAQKKTYGRLTEIHPENGGFLEAIPLTSFVVMALADTGRKDSVVVKKGIQFILNSVRADGGWPIDTNLATWVTTLSINALAVNPDFVNILSLDDRKRLQQWLLSQQHEQLHPYTCAAPGGWAWTNSPGAVPDADDTAGALLALHNLDLVDESVLKAVKAATEWLLKLQNKDGGVPTFCRGWNKLPFDRSTPDITAHAIAALDIWFDVLSGPMKKQVDCAITNALDYLARAQRADGSWIPLWFGNQFDSQQQNPVYGTAKVIISLSRMLPRLNSKYMQILQKAVQWVLSVQNPDGSWGASKTVKPSIEETALAVDALAGLLNVLAITAEKDYKTYPPVKQIHSKAFKGAAWLIKRVENVTSLTPSPIGLYFAKLWYFEELYPVIFTLSAMAKMQKLCESP